MVNSSGVWIAAVSIAVGALMWQMAGFSAVVGPSPADSLESGQEFNKTANNSSVNTGFGGDAQSSDGSLVGLSLSAISAAFNLIGFGVLLPWELHTLGLPWWAAWPLGILGWTLLSFGLLQFARGGAWR